MKTRLIILFCISIARHAVSQSSDIEFVFTNPVFQNYTMKNGLSSNHCNDVLQDKQGFIWVATLNGLNRFNGNKWQRYQQQSPEVKHRLPANWVIDLDEDNASNIWINTDRGIAKYDRAKDSVISYGYPVKGWGKIACTGTEAFFVSSWSGIERFKQEADSLVSKNYYPETEKNSFTHLFYDSGNYLWACPEDNPLLIRIHTKTYKLDYYKHLLIDGLQQSPVLNSVSKLSADTLLLNTKNEGILKYSIKSAKATRFISPSLISKDEVSCSVLYELNRQQFLLIGTKNSGMYAVNLATGAMEHYVNNHNDPGSIASNNITAVFADNNKGVWIATTKGLSFFHPSLQKNKFYYFYNNGVIPSGVLINSVVKTGASEFLIGTDNYGLFLYNASTEQTRKIPINHITRISSFCKAGKNEVLIGTNFGLYSYTIDKSTCAKRKINGKEFGHSILKVKDLGGPYIALCTTSGLLVYDLDHDKALYSEMDNTNNDERKICKDAFMLKDDLWILRFFNGYGVYNLHTKTYKDHTPAVLINKPVDYHNLSSDASSLYISTSAGIIVQNLSGKRKSKLLKTVDGLKGDQVENVCSVTKDKLYYTTPEALYCFNPTSGNSRRVASYENYSQKWFNQLELMEDSMLLYTVSDYFMVSKPYLDFNNHRTPSFVVEQVMINEKPQSYTGDTLVLAYSQNNISFSLAGLVYPESEKNTWYYKLNVLDTSLRYTTTGDIQLNNLPPNDYRLTIYSVNNEGVPSGVSKLIYINIRQPFYNTWWFYILVVISITAFVCLLYLYRLRQEMHLVKIRNQISRDLHDELGANVSSIHIMAKMLLGKGKGEIDPVLANISKYSVQISDTINDIIWNVNPKFDSVEELIKKMIRYASETLEGAQINYTVDVPKLTSKIELDNQFKYHLYLMFKEIINNAAKHSGADMVNIMIKPQPGLFSFRVQDNGKGFNTSDPDNGNGLYNLRSRAKDIQATLHISSVPGKGTDIELTVKLK